MYIIGNHTGNHPCFLFYILICQHGPELAHEKKSVTSQKKSQQGCNQGNAWSDGQITIIMERS